MNSKSPKKPIENQLACLLMCALTLPLNILPVHEWAIADPPPPPCSDEDPTPPELHEILNAQKSIHESLFSDKYNACDDFSYFLNAEITQSPSLVTGVTAKDERFTLVLSLVARITEWDDVPGLTQQQIQDLNAAQAAVSFINGEMAGPVQSRKIGAMSFSVNGVGGRLSVLIPLFDFGAITLPIIVNCQYADAEYWNCRRNAVLNEINCLQDAESRWDNCVSAAAWTFGAAVVACAIAGGIAYLAPAAAKVAIGLCVAAGVAVTAVVVALRNCYQNYDDDVENCRQDFETAVEICCNDAEIRYFQGG